MEERLYQEVLFDDSGRFGPAGSVHFAGRESLGQD